MRAVLKQKRVSALESIKIFFCKKCEEILKVMVDTVEEFKFYIVNGYFAGSEVFMSFGRQLNASGRVELF